MYLPMCSVILCALVTSHSSESAGCKAYALCHVQVGFKRELIKEVRLFVLDAQEFRQDWEANGPMVPGLDPMDAVDRLKKFQLMFEVRTASQNIAEQFWHHPDSIIRWQSQHCDNCHTT